MTIACRAGALPAPASCARSKSGHNIAPAIAPPSFRKRRRVTAANGSGLGGFGMKSEREGSQRQKSLQALILDWKLSRLFDRGQSRLLRAGMNERRSAGISS